VTPKFRKIDVELENLLKEMKPTLKPKARKEWTKMSGDMVTFYNENLPLKVAPVQKRKYVRKAAKPAQKEKSEEKVAMPKTRTPSPRSPPKTRGNSPKKVRNESPGKN